MSRGLVVSKRHAERTDHNDHTFEFVVSEFDTDKQQSKELMTGMNLEDILKQVPSIELQGGYDGGVVIDLVHPTE